VFAAVVEEATRIVDAVAGAAHAGSATLARHAHGGLTVVAASGTAAAGAGDSAISVPIAVGGRRWGMLTVRPAGAAETEMRLRTSRRSRAPRFANIKARTALAASRARIVAATDEARPRLERDIHDGAQQRLVSLALQLRSAEVMTPAGLDDVRRRIAGVADGLSDVVDDLRELSRGIHPAILSEGGLSAAVRALGRRSAVPVRVSADVPDRLDERIEVAAYYVVSEALTNAAKHAGATHVDVNVAVDDLQLDIAVTDDGRGGADPQHSSGRVGVRDRVETLGGRLAIVSPKDAGTTITVKLPLQPAAAGTLLPGG
jgi:signal transduction histidine kinase